MGRWRFFFENSEVGGNNGCVFGSAVQQWMPCSGRTTFHIFHFPVFSDFLKLNRPIRSPKSMSCSKKWFAEAEPVVLFALGLCSNVSKQFCFKIDIAESTGWTG